MFFKLDNLGNKTGDEIVALVVAIPPTVTSLDLSWNDLYNMTGAELVAIVAAIPATVTSLDLRRNGLGIMTGAELVDIMAAMPATVASLNLSGNDLYNMTGAELVAIVVAIPPTVTSLDLSWNFLGDKKGDELVALVTAIPATVTSLDLSWNCLGDKKVAEVVALVAAIPANVTSLDLSGNCFRHMTTAVLADVFAALPASVTTLKLADNLNAGQSDAIIKALPVGVKSIILDGKIIDRNEYWAKQLMVDVAQLTAKQGMARFAFDTIELPIEIDGSLLNRFIEFLEKQNNPIADLTCGLLLEGQIETTTDILENCSEYDEHRERRNHDAISFYTKTANDAAIKPIAEFLLRNMKTTCPSISVQNRLALYDLAPQDNYTCEFNQASKNRLGVSTLLLSNLGLFKSSAEPEPTVMAPPDLELDSGF